MYCVWGTFESDKDEWSKRLTNETRKHDIMINQQYKPHIEDRNEVYSMMFKCQSRFYPL